MQLADFDGVTYRLSTPNADNRNVVRLSMSMKCYQPDLVPYGAKEKLGREYGPLLQSQPESGFDVTLEVDLSQVAPSDRCMRSMVKW